ncbi:hypothetical protein J11TS1_09290 [Oceanobacillus sp. J11TS1]|nr:hypothetical protein J11TS1_09290 [Oceanobacillus sp. J11TS1]
MLIELGKMVVYYGLIGIELKGIMEIFSIRFSVVSILLLFFSPNYNDAFYIITAAIQMTGTAK